MSAPEPVLVILEVRLPSFDYEFYEVENEEKPKSLIPIPVNSLLNQILIRKSLYIE